MPSSKKIYSEFSYYSVIFMQVSFKHQLKSTTQWTHQTTTKDNNLEKTGINTCIRRNMVG